MMNATTTMAALVLSLALLAAGVTVAQDDAAKPTKTTTSVAALEYRAYVAAESADEIYRIVFDGKSARVEQVINVGYQPTEIEGPHGLTVDPEGKHWFVTMAHGKPFGTIYKYTTATNTLVGRTDLGMFPATMQISPATGLLYCVNFNLHGRMLPSTISVVDPEAMVEVARTETGPMPHGSRVSVDGLSHFSCAMMSGHLFEIDAVTFDVKRRLQLDETQPQGHDSLVKPTWAHPHPDGKRLYVALNAAAQIAEVDLEKWRVVRRFRTGKGPYNLEVTPDGKKLVASYKTDGVIGIWDIDAGKELVRISSTRRVTHGVTITPDGRYAFVTSEGIGSEKGAVDIVDLKTNKRSAKVDVGLQAGGIAFWKTSPRAASGPKDESKKSAPRAKMPRES